MSFVKNYFFILIILVVPRFISTCPTCVAKIKPESPPFFTTDFYQPGQSKTVQTKQEYAHAELKKLQETIKENK